MVEDETGPVYLLQKTYSGVRTTSAREVSVAAVDASGEPVVNPLHVRTELLDRAPGFDWANDSAGAFQLALAMLADYFGDDDLALRLHERFQAAVVGRLPRDHWTLRGEEIVEACRRLP